MNLIRSSFLVAVVATGFVVLSAPAARAADDDGLAKTVIPFLTAHCIKCHGPDKQSGDVRLDDLSADAKHAAEVWANVRDQIRDGSMPPPKEPRPDSVKARAVVVWATAALGAKPSRLPNQGNLIPHELLFGRPASGGEASTSRVWRLSPEAYMGFLRDVSRARVDGVVQPFSLIPERGINDFAGLYSIDEPSTEILLRNSEAIVAAQTAHIVKDGQVSGKNESVREFVVLMDPAATPTRTQLEAAIQTQFRMAVGRAAEPDAVTRLIALYEKVAASDDRAGAAKTMLQAVLLRTDAMYRSELGMGKADGTGRRVLAPAELARALSLAIGDRREPGIVQAAIKGELSTKEQIGAQLRRMLDDPKLDKPRVLKFFRQYFEYGKAVEVFKDKPEDAFKNDPERFKHEPAILAADTDRLIEHILADDQDVFRRLLTTSDSYVNFAIRKDKTSGKMAPARASIPPPPARKDKNQRPIHGPEYVYGFDIPDWPAAQPAPLPKDTRIGILMQPSWLVAFSTNFDNDPVRRGRWIRERLLGGTVPDLPIGVVAQVPNDPHRTFRDRLTVTRAAQCWKCHQRMDELGLPFENFEHYGRFRTSETVLDPEATAKNIDAKGKSLGPVTRQAELDTTGRIDDSGDPKLDGPVKDPREMLRKLADSDRCRQVFVRHAFRYFLGRNESLSDAKTLQDADKTYVESRGSFKALVVSLLTSDSFIYRSTAEAKQPTKGESK